MDYGQRSSQQGVDVRALVHGVLASRRQPLYPIAIIQSLRDAGKRLQAEDQQRLRQALAYEARQPEGTFVRTENGYELRHRLERRLRTRVRREAAALGFQINRNQITRPTLTDKSSIRDFHAAARKEKLDTNASFIERYETDLLECFANGSDLQPNMIWPRLEIVQPDKESGRLFRYASLLWSVPVSEGYGRRVRFLVWDEHSEKLLGIFALGDPVFNLSCRDLWIGWDHKDRAKRLYNVMDIFVLGAVPPFNTLLGGKLVAMLASSEKVQKVIEARYKDTRTVISKSKKDSRLALLTTGAALGRSALYDRITFGGDLLYQRIGESKGWGHFHLNHGLFDELRGYLDATVAGKSGNRFGSGPNWKIRTMRTALNQLGIPENLLQHGVKRDIYAVPLANNFVHFLKGENDKLDRKNLAFDDLATYWKERWLTGRAERRPDYKDFQRETISQLIRGVATPGGKG